MLSDLRLALRNLAKSPGFAAVTIATLALCIGANSAIFSIINAVLLKPLPYPDSERLVAVYNTYPGNGLDYAGVSIPDYLDRMERAPSIEDGALYTWDSYNLSSEDASPVRLLGLRATPSFFTTLHSGASIGRTFGEEHGQIGNEKVVVLSHGMWQDNFGGETDILGQSIRLNGESYEVIGVMPESFAFPQSNVRLWIPFAFTDEQRSMNERGNEYSEMIARLQPGTTPEMLTTECATIIEQNLEAYPQFRPFVESSGFTGIAKSLLEQNVEDVRPMLWLLQAGVVAALLIGCANVANLLLTRSLTRTREFAIRAALGATRWVLVRQLLIESLILFLIGGTLGLLVALWGLTGMESWGVLDLPRGETIALDAPVFLFTLGCAGFTGLVFGLVPALQASRPSASDALQSGSIRSTATKRQRTLRNVLVVGEVALSLMLVTTAALLIRSFKQLESQSPGFDATSVLTARISLPESEYQEDQQLHNFIDRVQTELAALPGVEAVGVTNMIPFGYSNSQGSYRIVGHPSNEEGSPPHAQLRSSTAGYFESLRIPLVRGRWFNAADNAEGAKVVVVDQIFVDRYFPDSDPIGQQLYRGEDNAENYCTIVGVVNPVKHRGLDDRVRKETLYFPYAQRPVHSITLALRTAVPPTTLVSSVRFTVSNIDPNLPVYQFRTLEERISSSLQRQRTPMVLLSLFGGMALLLATLGVYGTLVFSVSQRTQELGIRMALGAATRDVLGLIMRQGLSLILIGTTLGIVGYAASSRLLQHLLFEVQPLDPFSIGLAVIVLAAVATVACYLPARRATRIDPVVALRDE